MGKKRIKEDDTKDALEKARIYIQALQAGRQPLDVTDFMIGHMVFNGENTTGWVHTHGMWELFGVPDLEIRGVRPIFLMQDAGVIMNQIAQYMVDGQVGRGGAKPVKVNEAIGFGGPQRAFRVVEAKPIEPDAVELHYKTPRWEIVMANQPVCIECEKGTKDHVH